MASSASDTATASEEDAPAAEESESSSSEEPEAEVRAVDVVALCSYATEKERDAFDPTVMRTPQYTQWKRSIQFVYDKYIDPLKKLKKQKWSFKR